MGLDLGQLATAASVSEPVMPTQGEVPHRQVLRAECNRQREGCLKHLSARNGRLYSPNYPSLLNERIHDG